MTASRFVVSVSRRGALGQFAGAGLGIAIAVRGGNIAAQEATPEVAADMDAPIPLAWLAAWNAHDADRLLALYAEDAVYEEIPTNTVSEGHDAIRIFFEGTNAAVANIELTPVNAFQADGWALLEAMYAGDYVGEPGGEGKPFVVPFVTVFELDGDKIRRNADYFDLSSLLAQIEAPAGESAEATPAA